MKDWLTEDSHCSMEQNITGLAASACASGSLWSQWCGAAKISSAVSSPCKGEQDLCWCWWYSCYFVLLKQRVEKNHLCMVRSAAYKILQVPKTMRKLGVPESQELQGSSSQVFMLFTMLRLGAQIVLPWKAVSLAEPLILVFRGSTVCWVSPKGGREGGRDSLLQDFWKALPLFRVQVGWGA